ncbi:MAG: class I SAM-dependent methyltransferase [Moorea sp. SIOASIH]|uniref:class I SAM-dependent methyltransferase n=1 Tax=Moorena sp. SIOASIH TaxID=2607817 RepID=UPI0013B98937|nr:class I SAM-dependent methyltransferase [Moorena sp. SIOASIH]NEO41400.1 class I SAM-dependent methyltransferase [Moorena sp. SIOASIH]
MNNLLIKYAKRLLITSDGKNLPAMEYWKKRANKYGKRSVLNIGHSNAEFEAVTEKQKREILPYLRQSLKGDEKLILDFGCGPGRFTIDLASTIGGKAIGVDPIEALLEIAPKDKTVEYKLMEEGQIPLPDNSVDVVWVCLVLGGIKSPVLERTTEEIIRVLKDDGLLFLVENTSNKPDTQQWFFRSKINYNKMFKSVLLVHLHDYFDLGECISIMAGRKSN